MKRTLWASAALALLLAAGCDRRSEKNPSGLFVVTQNGRVGYIDREGEVVIPPQFDRAYGFTDGLAVVEIGGRYGYIDEEGRFAINPRFDDAFSFYEGLAAFKAGDRMGYLDRDGEVVIPPQFEDAGDFKQGLARVRVGGRHGYIDEEGKFAINPQFDEAQPFSEGRAAVKVGGRWGFIDRDGKMVVPAQYEEAFDFAEGKALVKSNGSYGFIDEDGEVVIAPQFDNAYSFSEGLASVGVGDRGGYVGEDGKLAINAAVRVGRPLRRRAGAGQGRRPLGLRRRGRQDRHQPAVRGGLRLQRRPRRGRRSATPAATSTAKGSSSGSRANSKPPAPGARICVHAHPTADGFPLPRRPRRRPRRRPDQAAALPRHPRRPGGLHLRRRPLAGAGGRRHRDPADRASRARAVRQVLARRPVDRLHRPVRRRRAGLRRCRPPAACRSSSPSIPARGPLHAALGLRQPGLRLDAGRQGGPLPLAARRLGPRRLAPLHGAGGRRPRRAAADARSRAPATSRPTASGSSTRRSPATSAPGSATRAAGRRTSTSSTSPATTSTQHHRPPAHRARPDVDRRHDLLHLRPQRHAEPLRLRPRRAARSTQLTQSTAVGRALAERRTNRGGSSTSWAASCTVLDTAQRAEPARSRSPCPTTASTTGRRRSRPPSRSRTSALSPKGERALFVARGDVFTAPIEKGATRNLTRILERARQVGALVARRPEDRVHLRRERRGRGLDLVNQDGSGTARAAHPRRQGDALRARLVAGRQAHRLQRQGRQALRAHSRRQEARRGRATTRSARSATTTWSPDGGYLAFSVQRRQRLPLDLDLERRRRQARGG